MGYDSARAMLSGMHDSIDNPYRAPDGTAPVRAESGLLCIWRRLARFGIWTALAGVTSIIVSIVLAAISDGPVAGLLTFIGVLIILVGVTIGVIASVVSLIARMMR